MVPVSVVSYRPDGSATIQQILLENEQAKVSLPADTTTVKINPDQTGFYHVCYTDADNLARLGEMVRRRQLAPVDRWGLQNDLFALVKAGRAPMATWLDLAENYSGECSYLPLSSLDSHLFEAFLVLRGDIRTRAGQTAMALMNAGLAAIGHLPVPDESQTTAMLRDQLFIHGALIGNPEVLAFLTDPFEAFLKGSPVAPDIFRGVVTAGAVSGSRPALEAMIARLEASGVEHERMTLVGALGAFSQWPLLEKALAYALEKIPDRIRFMTLAAAAGNPAAVDRLWPWFEANFTSIERMHPLLFERVVAAFVPGPGLQDPDRTRTYCNGLLQTHPRLKDVIALSLERLAVNAAFRRREHQGS